MNIVEANAREDRMEGPKFERDQDSDGDEDDG
jgi:hypothetical protein